jgi:hypothetical protein
LAAGILAACLAACTSTSTNAPTAPVVVTPAVPITLGELVGNWGLASFRNEADQARTAVQAKAACGNPYKITQGPRGGVLMYLADQTQPTEVFLKVAPDGKTFIGPQGPPAMRQDRLVVSFDKGELVAQWVDPSVATRYGTMILVRCGAK